MPKPIADPAAWIEAPVVVDQAQVHERIPQRHEMAFLNGVLHHDKERGLAVGFHQTAGDDFWVRGHVPGRPLMPGVAMVECAAQLCAFLASFDVDIGEGEIFGFGGLDEVRFRGQVVPGDKVLIMAELERRRRTFAYYKTQAFTGTRMVYEGTILGVSI